MRALLTVNSPVDCLRIELIIKPLPKKAPNFRCFFPLFMLYYAVFTCFSHIDKITAHGLFRTLLFHFHIVFVHFVPHNPRNPFGTSSKKHQSQVKFVSDYFFFFYLIFYSLCEFIYADLMLFGNSFGIIFLSLSSFPSLIASL